MSEIKRLIKNIKILVDIGGLEAELLLIPENEVNTIEDLNDWIEESMTYWEE